MSRALPGWVLFADARVHLKKRGLYRAAADQLERVYKRRLQPKPGKRRRRYWYMRQEDFDRIEQEVKAACVEKVLGLPDDVCLLCGGGGEVNNQTPMRPPVLCPDCHGTGELR